MKEMVLANGSKLKYECGGAYCYLPCFEINGIEADYHDFGTKEDIDPENAPEYGCGNMKFLPTECEKKVLEKYGITEKEYNQICKELDCLSFGSCGWCE